MADSDNTIPPQPTLTDHHIRQLARVVLLVFLLTFMLSRVVVFLIMDHLIPDLYMHMGGTHVHHLNYGIFLLVSVGAVLLFSPPEGRQRTVCAVLYAIGLGLTFDEFGMWLHLGGGYWQRASFDAITVISAVLALIAYAPAQGSWTRKHFLATTLLVISMAVFVTLFAHSREAEELGSRLHQLEQGGPQ
jgi:hypothetical protein